MRISNVRFTTRPDALPDFKRRVRAPSSRFRRSSSACHSSPSQKSLGVIPPRVASNLGPVSAHAAEIRFLPGAGAQRAARSVRPVAERAARSLHPLAPPTGNPVLGLHLDWSARVGEVGPYFLAHGAAYLAGYISATSDSTPSVAKGSQFSNRSFLVKTAVCRPPGSCVTSAARIVCGAQLYER